MNNEEALKLFNEILAECKDLTEKDSRLILPGAGEIESHGYQLEIKSKTMKANLQIIKSIVEKHNLAMADRSKNDSVIIFRPCFLHYSGGDRIIKR